MGKAGLALMPRNVRVVNVSNAGVMSATSAPPQIWERVVVGLEVICNISPSPPPSCSQPPHASSQPSCPPSSPILTIGHKITLFVKSHSVLAVRQSKGVKFLRKLFHGQMVAKFMQHQCCELQNRALASPLLIL